VVQLALMRSQANFDIAQAFSMRELGKCHDEILVETTEAFYVALAFIYTRIGEMCAWANDP